MGGAAQAHRCRRCDGFCGMGCELACAVACYTPSMLDDIEKVLIDRREIAARVAAVARQITADLQADASQGGNHPLKDGEGLTLVPILTGSVIFLADLMRHLPLRLRIRLVAISSYPGTATTSRGATILEHLTNLPQDLSGQHVLLIDDILDSGTTLRAATALLQQRNAAEVRTCVLLRKPRPESLAMKVDYCCFEIPDAFVVGYGLDYNDFYRNLPDIVTLKPGIIAAAK